MELNAEDRFAAMRDRHHDSLLGLGIDVEVVGERGAVDDEGVVARRAHRLGTTGEETATIKMATVAPEHLVFVDETGATTAMGRTYGRAPAGERVEATAPGIWKNVTLISGLRSSGVVAPMALAGATDRQAFETYVERVLVPELRADDVVVWDNLSPHKSASAIAAIEAVGARVEPLPVYSPDLSPIEEMFSKVKEGLRSIAARSIDKVIGAMRQVLNKVTQHDVFGWFLDRCAYAMHP